VRVPQLQPHARGMGGEVGGGGRFLPRYARRDGAVTGGVAHGEQGATRGERDAASWHKATRAYRGRLCQQAGLGRGGSRRSRASPGPAKMPLLNTPPRRTAFSCGAFTAGNSSCSAASRASKGWTRLRHQQRNPDRMRLDHQPAARRSCRQPKGAELVPCWRGSLRRQDGTPRSAAFHESSGALMSTMSTPSRSRVGRVALRLRPHHVPACNRGPRGVC